MWKPPPNQESLCESHRPIRNFYVKTIGQSEIIVSKPPANQELLCENHRPIMDYYVKTEGQSGNIMWKTIGQSGIIMWKPSANQELLCENHPPIRNYCVKTMGQSGGSCLINMRGLTWLIIPMQDFMLSRLVFHEIWWTVLKLSFRNHWPTDCQLPNQICVNWPKNQPKLWKWSLLPIYCQDIGRD